MTPNSFQASEAANLLGIDLFYLAAALRSGASHRFKVEADRVRSYERPNFGQARALLRAAEACEASYDEESAARVAAACPSPGEEK